MRNLYLVLTLSLAFLTGSCSLDPEIFYHEDETYAEASVNEDVPDNEAAVNEPEESTENAVEPLFVVPDSTLSSVPPVSEIVGDSAEQNADADQDVKRINA